MEKKHFFLKLIPRRPDFAQTMTEVEKSIMQEHIVYWKNYMNKGMVIVFGPVMDPKGTYGMGIIEADNAEDVKKFTEGDPASKINIYEFYPMRAVLPGK